MIEQVSEQVPGALYQRLRMPLSCVIAVSVRKPVRHPRSKAPISAEF